MFESKEMENKSETLCRNGEKKGGKKTGVCENENICRKWCRTSLKDRVGVTASHCKVADRTEGLADVFYQKQNQNWSSHENMMPWQIAMSTACKSPEIHAGGLSDPSHPALLGLSHSPTTHIYHSESPFVKKVHVWELYAQHRLMTPLEKCFADKCTQKGWKLP